LFIFSTPGFIRHLWQLKTVVFLHWCLICSILFLMPTIGDANRWWGDSRLARFKATTKINKWSSLLWAFKVLSITKLSMKGLFVTLSLNNSQNKWNSTLQHSVWLNVIFNYKKRFVLQNKLTLLLKFVLHNTWTLQLFTII
jgi:hypothetical protein